MCLDNKHHWLCMAIWWRWDKKWGTPEVFQGRYRALLCLCYHKLSGQKCCRWEMKCMSEQRQTNPGLTNRFAIHLHENSTWPCLRRGGHPVIWFTERRQSKAAQHSYKPKKGVWEIPTEMMMQGAGIVTAELCTNKGIQTMREGWRTDQPYLWESMWLSLQSLIKKKSYFRLAEAVFSC